MATRKDVAERAGVSVATVSYVVNKSKNVTPEVKQRVLDAIDALNYRPNLVARSLVTQKTRHVAMLVDNLKNPYYCEMLEGAQQIAAEQGYIVSVISVDLSNEESVLELASRGVDGVIWAVANPNVKMKHKIKIPCVTTGDYVFIDYKQAMYDMVDCLVKNGHSDIAFLSGITLDPSINFRFKYFVEALKAKGLEVDTDLNIEVNNDGKTNEESGEMAMETLLEKKTKFSAVFALNDLMAMGAATILRKEGLSIPEDVSIVGCDHISVLKRMSPSLSTIDTQAFNTGENLMQLLIDTINTAPKKHQIIKTEFICKESIGKKK